MVSVISSKEAESLEVYAAVNKKEELDRLASILHKPIAGEEYSLIFEKPEIDDIFDILRAKQRYEHIRLYISVSKDQLAQVARYYPSSISKGKSNFDIYRDLIAEFRLNINQSAFYPIYSAIVLANLDMREAIEMLYNNFKHSEITKSNVNKFLLISDVVYPRDVIIAFLTGYPYRDSKLRKLTERLPAEICYHACRKALWVLVKRKLNYLETGHGGYPENVISQDKLISMILAFDETQKMVDISITLKSYEKGKL